MIDWMMEVCMEFTLKRETLHLKDGESTVFNNISIGLNPSAECDISFLTDSVEGDEEL